MNCPNCGNELHAGAKFCNSCGSKIEVAAPVQEQPQPAPQQPYYQPQQPVYTPTYTPAEPAIPAEYAPLSPWKYFWYNILFSIPVVGFVFLIVFSCGGARNLNLRNYARSFFCALLIGVIALVVIVVLCVAAGVSFGELIEFNNYYY